MKFIRLIFVALALSVLAPDIAQSQLSAEQEIRLRQALMKSVVTYYNTLGRNAAGFEKHMLLSFPESDRKALRPILKEIKTFPTMTARNTSLIVKDNNGRTLEVRRDFEFADRYYFNGITWVYNPHQPLLPQLALLAQKLELQEKKKSALLLMILPEAQAQAAAAKAGAEAAASAVVKTTWGQTLKTWGALVAAGALGATLPDVTAWIKTAGTEAICEAYFKPVRPSDHANTIGPCREHFKKLFEASRVTPTTIVANPAKARIGTSAQKLEDKWKAVTHICPINDDGKPRILYMRFCERDKRDPVRCIRENDKELWWRLYNVQEGGTVENPGGKMQVLWVLPDNVKPTDTDAENKALERFLFNKDTGAFTGIEIKSNRPRRGPSDNGYDLVEHLTNPESQTILSAIDLFNYAVRQSVACDAKLTEQEKDEERAQQGAPPVQRPNSDPKAGATVESVK